jgi:hypothetical protein
MKITARVSLAFKELSYSDKISFGSGVIHALSGTDESGEPVIDLFPNLPVPLDELQIINNNASGYLAEAQSGLRVARSALKQSIKEWNNAFTLTANYINMVAQGRADLMSVAGFYSTKNDRAPKPKPETAVTFKATVGSGRSTINAGIKKGVKGARAYVFAAVPEGVNIKYAGDTMIIEVEGKQLFINAVTQKKTTFYNMQSGKPYKLSMYAINNAGAGVARNGEQVIPQ